MSFCEFGEGRVKVTLCADAPSELRELGSAVFERNARAAVMVDELVDVGAYGGNKRLADRFDVIRRPVVSAHDDAVSERSSDACPEWAVPALDETLDDGVVVADEVDVDRFIVAVPLCQGAEEPAQSIVDLDVLIRICKPVLADSTRQGLVA